MSLFLTRAEQHHLSIYPSREGERDGDGGGDGGGGRGGRAACGGDLESEIVNKWEWERGLLKGVGGGGEGPIANRHALLQAVH